MNPDRSATAPARRRPRVAPAVAVLALLLGVALVMASHATAHVTATADRTTAGMPGTVEMSFTHGCGPLGTTALRISIPDEVASVIPYEQAGWQVTMERGEAEGADEADEAPMHGTDEVEGDHAAAAGPVETVEYARTGEPVPTDIAGRFSLAIVWAEGATGQAVAFPTIQECEDGESYAWIDEQGSAEPAPTVMLDGPGDSGQATGEQVDEVTITDDDADDERDLGPWIVAVGAMMLAIVTLVIVLGGRRRG